jgi:hypothetical protein
MVKSLTRLIRFAGIVDDQRLLEAVGDFLLWLVLSTGLKKTITERCVCPMKTIEFLQPVKLHASRKNCEENQADPNARRQISVSQSQYPAARFFDIAFNAGYNHAAEFAHMNKKKAVERSDKKKNWCALSGRRESERMFSSLFVE